MTWIVWTCIGVTVALFIYALCKAGNWFQE